MDAAEKFSNRISQEKNLRTKTLTGASVLLLGLTAFPWFNAYSLNSNAMSERMSVPAEGTPNAIMNNWSGWLMKSQSRI